MVWSEILQFRISLDTGQGRQSAARVLHFARQAISNGTQEFKALHINFVTIHTEGIGC